MINSAKKDDVSAATMNALGLAVQLVAPHPDIPTNNYLIAFNDRTQTLKDHQ